MAYDTATELLAAFPWLDTLGFKIQDLRDIAVDAAGNPDLIVANIRQSPQYQARFPAIRRPDGSLRMNEGQYVQMEGEFKNLLRQYGFPPEAYEKPQDVASLFESDQDVEELRGRLQTYQAVRDAGQPVRDAFFAYAGIDLSVDDLFEAVVNEDVGQRLQQEYLTNTTGGVNYEEFIDRTTQVAMRRIERRARGREMTRARAKRLIDVLYTNRGDDDRVLSLEELLSTFEAATLAGTATAAGLEMPTKDRVMEFRAAGVQQAQARQAYMEYALQGRTLSADAARAGQGEISQERFENAAFLGDADATKALRTATAYAESVGQSGGGFTFERRRDGGIMQTGLG